MRRAFLGFIIGIVLIVIGLPTLASDLNGSPLVNPTQVNGDSSVVVNEIIVNVNNKRVIFDVKPTIIQDKTMVPLRAIFEALGAHVTWDGETNTIYGSKDSIGVELKIDNKIALVNSKVVLLDVAPQIIEGRTLVPARFIAESLSADVKWDEATSTINITTNNPSPTPSPTPTPELKPIKSHPPAKIISSGNYSGLNITSDTIMLGKIFVNGDIYINNNATLIIGSDAVPTEVKIKGNLKVIDGYVEYHGTMIFE